MVCRVAAFPAAFSVGVPSIPRVVCGGWGVCAGVIRTASDACFGGVCWGVRPGESWGVRWGWGGAGPPVVDSSCVDLKHSAFLAQLLLEEVDLESTSEPASPVGKPVLHMQPMHTGEPVARSADALARLAANNMRLSEHDTQELRRLLYLKAEGIERQERLQYLRQTWKSSIWSEEDEESYTLPDPEIPLVYSLHYGQQCPPDWDDGSVPAETADGQKKKEHGKSNLHAEEDFLQKLESLNLTPAGRNC